jgi:hypothetical protein
MLAGKAFRNNFTAGHSKNNPLFENSLLSPHLMERKGWFWGKSLKKVQRTSVGNAGEPSLATFYGNIIRRS